jgi:hypothetical protein
MSAELANKLATAKEKKDVRTALAGSAFLSDLSDLKQKQSIAEDLIRRRKALGEDDDDVMEISPPVKSPLVEMFEKIADRVKVEDGFKPKAGPAPAAPVFPDRKRKLSTERSIRTRPGPQTTTIMPPKTKRKSEVDRLNEANIDKPLNAKRTVTNKPRKKTKRKSEVDRLNEANIDKPLNAKRTVTNKPPKTKRKSEVDRLNEANIDKPRNAKRTLR